MSSMQSDFRRLMSEIDYSSDRKIVIKNPKLYDDLISPDSGIDFSEENIDGNDVIVFTGLEFERFQDLPNAHDDDSWEEYKDPMDEMTDSSGAGAYNASLHAKPKQYKGPELKESANPQSGNAAPFGSGYKAVKGFRAGHTKDKGGFQYKDLWNLNEEQFNELVSTQDKNKIDRLLHLIQDKAPELYNKFIGWMKDPYTAHDYKDYETDVTNAQIQGIDISSLGLAEREETKLDDLKIGDKIVIDKSVNNSWNHDGFGNIVAFHKDEVNGDQVIVDITNGGGSTFTRPGVSFPKEKISLQQGEIDKKEKKEKKKETEKEKKAIEKEPIKEGFKTEIKVRSKKQQFQEAMKRTNMRLKEIHNILEFASGIKNNLNEAEYAASSKLMENMKRSLAEAYKKMKNL